MSIQGIYQERQPVQIHIKWGQIKGLTRIKSALHAAIIAAFERAVDNTVVLMKDIVPESIKRRPPYSTKQQERSERMMRTAIRLLEDSFAVMELGTLKKRYFLKFGYTASYARHINIKRNVKKWSKAGSETGFAGQTKRLLIQEIRKELKIELAKDPELRGFVGAREFG